MVVNNQQQLASVLPRNQSATIQINSMSSNSADIQSVSTLDVKSSGASKELKFTLDDLEKNDQDSVNHPTLTKSNVNNNNSSMYGAENTSSKNRKCYEKKLYIKFKFGSRFSKMNRIVSSVRNSAQWTVVVVVASIFFYLVAHPQLFTIVRSVLELRVREQRRLARK